MSKVLVTGAGGFIGGHLVKRLKEDGHYVRGVDIKWPEFRETVADEFKNLDLRVLTNAKKAVKGMDWVFNLAADMGGIGYIGTVLASITRNNSLINNNMVEATRESSVEKFFFSSSACVYNASKQADTSNEGLKESDAHPADPEAGYGWEKLFTEKLCEYYEHDYTKHFKVARFHNVYGPYGTYEGGREKAPAAICRKVALCPDNGTIDVWGDGQQTRTFLYIDDCIEGVIKLMHSEFSGPVNIGSEEMVTIDNLVDMVAEIAEKRIYKCHLVDKPQGVRARCSDNTLAREELGWEPVVRLESGLRPTYEWIHSQLQPVKVN